MSKELIQNYDFNKKLRCDAFSVLRPSDGTYKEGDKVEVKLIINTSSSTEEVHSYGLHRIESIEELTLDELRESEARLDTGMSANETRKLLKLKHAKVEIFDYMILVKVKQHANNPTSSEPNHTPSHSNAAGSNNKTASNVHKTDGGEDVYPSCGCNV